MSASQPPQDPNGGQSSGAPPTPPVNNFHFWGHYATSLQGVNFNDQSAQLSGFQPKYTAQGHPNPLHRNSTASQADYRTSDYGYPPPQDYGHTAQSSHSVYAEAPQDYRPVAQGLPTEGYTNLPNQNPYPGYAALTSNPTPQDSVSAVNDSVATSADYEWIHERLPTVHIKIAPTFEGCIATRDSGTVENWISQDIVDRFRLEVRKGLLEEHTTFDGKTLSSCETVQPTWCLRGSHKSYKCEFRVASDPPFDVLFGWSFLKRYPDLLDSEDAVSDDPLLVLVQRKKEPAEKRAIEQGRKKAQEDSTNLQQSQGKGENSRSRGTSGGQRHGSSSKRDKKESKRR